MELEPSPHTPVVPDERPGVVQLPPVRLVAISDVRLQAPTGCEPQLDAFYVGILAFEREGAELVYRAENFRLRFDLLEPPIAREDMRATGIEVKSLEAAEKKLIESERQFTRQRGLTLGSESLLLLDPAGNWVELTEANRLF